MCLILRKHDKVRKAILPKLVWKIVKVKENMWEGPYAGIRGKQVFGEQLRAVEPSLSGTGFTPVEHLVVRENSRGNNTINSGFHSYCSLKSAKSNQSAKSDQYYLYYEFFKSNELLDIVPCIIPRKSEYCKGIGNEIVSTDIIVFKSFRHLVDWKLEKIKFTWSRLFS